MKDTCILNGQILAASDGQTGAREILFYAGTPVLRTDGKRLFHLSFSLDPGAVNLDYLNSGRAPFVIDHVESIDHTLGVIDSARIDNGARAFVRFSDRPEFSGIVKDINDNKLSNVSMSARITGQLVPVTPVEKGIPHLQATKWEALHVSLVSRGADSAAQFLSDCQMEIPAELLADISAPTGAASEADNSAARAEYEYMRLRLLAR